MSANKKTSKLNGYFEDAVSAGGENIEAAAESAAILAKGAQDLNGIWFGMARSSIGVTAAAAQAFLGCTTVQEMIEVQSAAAKSNYEKMTADGRKISELSLKLAEEASRPIAKRLNETAETFIKRYSA